MKKMKHLAYEWIPAAAVMAFILYVLVTYRITS